MVDIDAEEALLSGLAGPAAVGSVRFCPPAPRASGQSFTATPSPLPIWFPPVAWDGRPQKSSSSPWRLWRADYEAVVIVAGILPAGAEDFDVLCGLADDAVIVTEEPASDAAVRSAYARLTGAGLKPVVVMLAAEDEVAAA